MAATARSAVAGVGRAGPLDARVAMVEGRVAAVAAPDHPMMVTARRGEVSRFARGLRSADRAVEDAAGPRNDPIPRETEVLEDRPRGRGRAEVIEPDDRPLVADPAIPAERHARL